MRELALSIRQTIPAWTNTNNILSHAMHYHLIKECQPFPIIITSSLTPTHYKLICRKINKTHIGMAKYKTVVPIYELLEMLKECMD
jgi:hypothetical protein